MVGGGYGSLFGGSVPAIFDERCMELMFASKGRYNKSVGNKFASGSRACGRKTFEVLVGSFGAARLENIY